MTPTPAPITLTLPIRVVSEANAHEHWRVRQRRAKEQRGLTAAACLRAWGGRLCLPATVSMTRLAPRMLDSDNAVGACKHVRDGIADAFGVDDRDGRYTWIVRQEKAKEYGVRIQITQD